MAQKVEVVLTCDLDDTDTPAVETVTFSFRGQTYEFELCQAHLDEFLAVMDGYTSSARRTTRGARSAGPAAAASGNADIGAIREWARANGHQVSDRGRIPASVRSAFDAARGMIQGALDAVVLAAGEGTRMRSARPKPLHLLCGRPMVVHVLDALAELSVQRVVVVVGHGAERVSKQVQAQSPLGLEIEFVEQRVQRGTGDAVSVALTGFTDSEDDDGDIVVLPGDTPLLRPPTLAALVRLHRQTDAACSVLTAVIDDAAGYGRIVRGKDDRVLRIVEEADASDDERQIREFNTSIYCFRRNVLAPALRRLSPENAQGEYYLSDIVEVLADAGYKVVSLIASDAMETAGVNDRAQLAIAEAELRDRTNERWMRRGVTMVDPEHTYVDLSVELAPDVTLFPGTILRGETVVGAGAEIGPSAHLVDTEVGERAIVEQTVAHQATIGPDSRVGPFAALQPGTVLAAGTVTGPFYHSALSTADGAGAPGATDADPPVRGA